MRGDEDDYYMDDEDDDGGSLIIPEDEDAGDESSDSVDDQTGGIIGKTDKSAYSGSNITEGELSMLIAYDQMRTMAAKIDDWNQKLYDLVSTLVAANPKNTDKTTVQAHMKEIMNTQGKNRILSSAYNPVGLMTSDDVDEEYTKTGESSIQINEDARNQIARFIDYLAKRDLSKDSLSSKKAKRRHIPAFIIFLFSSGMYDLIIDCPTMPELYKREINNAFKEINRTKLNLVEDLARQYEAIGRDIVAEKVRTAGVTWFEREPNELKSLADYKDILTSEDIMLYKRNKNKFNNVSRAITQDVMSKLIAVYQEDGTFETLKDKTRQEAVEEVKELYTNWSKNNPIDSEMAQNIIWKKI